MSDDTKQPADINYLTAQEEAEDKLYEQELLAGKSIRINGGELYVVATPIGRLLDITLRAVKTLESVDVIAAEDTRRAYVLLGALGIKKRVISNQKFNEHGKTAYFLSLLSEGKSIAIISDAGTPCVNDPGNELIKAALQAGVKVNTVPGCCAAIAGVSVSGFDLSSFAFRGFFPKDNSDKKAELHRYESQVTRTYIYYESPKRIVKAVEFFVDSQVDCRLCVCNDITKVHERFYRGAPQQVLSELMNNPNSDKGEYTLIVELSEDYGKQREQTKLSAEAAIVDAMSKYGITAREAVERLTADTDDYSKNELKSAVITLKRLFGG